MLGTAKTSILTEQNVMIKPGLIRIPAPLREKCQILDNLSIVYHFCCYCDPVTGREMWLWAWVAVSGGAPSSPPMPSGGAVQPRGSLGDSCFFSTTPQQPPPPPLSFTTAVNTVSALQLDSLHYVHVLVPQSSAGKPRNECSTADAIFLVFKKKRNHGSPINTSDCRSCA